MRLEDGEDFRFRHVEAQRFHRHFQLVVVDLLVFVQVEQVELWGKPAAVSVLESFVAFFFRFAFLPEPVVGVGAYRFFDLLLVLFRYLILLLALETLSLLPLALSFHPFGFAFLLRARRPECRAQ